MISDYSFDASVKSATIWFISSASIVSSGSAIITEHQTNNVDGWSNVTSLLDVSGSVDYSSNIIVQGKI